MPHLLNLNFDTWKSNHPDENDLQKKFYREIFPWNVFEKINFEKHLLNRKQSIRINLTYYYVIIKDIDLQENDRYKATIYLHTNTKSTWHDREWKEDFFIIYTQDYKFITAFDKRHKPEELVKKFMMGNFSSIEKARSYPIQQLLFRTLVYSITEKVLKGGTFYKDYEFLNDGLRSLLIPEKLEYNEPTVSPIYSIDRDLWIVSTINEEPANKLAIGLANQCKYLVVVYCNKSVFQHIKCSFPGVKVLSLSEYADYLQKELKSELISKVKFLQERLLNSSNLDPNELAKKIANNGTKLLSIDIGYLNEAYCQLDTMPYNINEAFYYLSSMNLINAYLSQLKKEKHALPKNTISKKYGFKEYLAKVIRHLIDFPIDGVDIYIDLEKDLTFIKVFEFQFSFHSLDVKNEMFIYAFSKENKIQEWTGKRLQPIAPLLLDYSRELLIKTC